MVDVRPLAVLMVVGLLACWNLNSRAGLLAVWGGRGRSEVVVVVVVEGALFYWDWMIMEEENILSYCVGDLGGGYE